MARCWACNQSASEGKAVCRNCVDVPTPAEIRQACEQIQATWDDHERERRATRFADPMRLYAAADDLDGKRDVIRCFAPGGKAGYRPLEGRHPGMD